MKYNRLLFKIKENVITDADKKMQVKLEITPNILGWTYLYLKALFKILFKKDLS